MKRVTTIGVVMDNFRPAILEGAGVYAREHGIRLDGRWSVRADWMPADIAWDGVVAYLVDGKETLNRISALGLPLLHLAGWLGPLARPRMEPDFAVAAALAVGEFQRLGLARVAGLEWRPYPIDRRAYRGLRLALRQAGMEFAGLYSWEKGISAGRIRSLGDELMAVERPFGLFLAHAGVAWSLVDELLERGIRIPEDISIIVIDKDVQGTPVLAAVPLTAVMLDDWQVGYEAAAWLHRMIRGEEHHQRILRVPPAGLLRRESTGTTTYQDPLVAKALHVIAGPVDADLTVDELAKRVGASRRNLEQRFRKVTGNTPNAAILKRRISEAKRLLEKGIGSLSEVAQASGFSSVHYFTTAFKREVGEAPGVYRRGKQETVRHATGGAQLGEGEAGQDHGPG
jgi:LacI family transcriptional regulator